MLGFLKKLFAGGSAVVPEGRLGVDELSRRLGVPVVQLRAVEIAYRKFEVPKRTGGTSN